MLFRSSVVSVYASQSFRQVIKHSVKPYIEQETADQMKTALNATAAQWGKEMVFVFSPANAEILAKNGYTPAVIQKELYERGRISRKEFGPRPLGATGLASGIPKWIDDLPDNGLVPVVPKPEDIKILVAGGKGPGCSFMIDRWGFGQSYFVSKEIKLPPNWKKLVKELQGWETPIEVK